MNIFAIIVLISVILESVLDCVGNLLNLRALKSEPPAALEEIYKPEDYKKSQKYIYASTRLTLIHSLFALLILLAFWFSGGFNYLDQIIRGWNQIPLVTGLLYISILVFVYSLLMLPFSIYDTFVIEEHFGFNKTTPPTFFFDIVKSLTISILLGGPLLTAVLALFQYGGHYAWLYCWATLVAFSLVIQYIAPTWIMPLFNKFTLMEAGQLKEAILGYASSVDFPIKNVFVIDGSKRSTKSNAFFTGFGPFFTGFGRNKRIALFDTLISQHSVQELVAILAHEVGHNKKKHILQRTVIGILQSGIILFLLSLFLDSSGLYQAFYMNHESIYSGLLFFTLLYTPIELVLSVVMQTFYRKHEYEADRFAAETIDNPQSLISALKKLSAGNLSNLTPHPFYVFINYSHPPLLQRIQAIQEIEHKLETAPK